MTIIHPPRREPRILALAVQPNGFAFAVCDPWELRSVSSVACATRSRSATLRHIVRREKPTAVVVDTPRLASSLRPIARRLRIPILNPRGPLRIDVAERMYNNYRARAPTVRLQRVVALAAAAVLNSDIPARHYAPRRNAAHERSA